MKQSNQKALESHLPCPCGKSSDAYTLYNDHGYCFSCSRYVPLGGLILDERGDTCSSDYDKYPCCDNPKTCTGSPDIEPIIEDNYSLQYIPWRGITKETMGFYAAKTKVDTEYRPLAIQFHYPNGRIKSRQIHDKKFFVSGDAISGNGSLLGLDKFPVGCARFITITEGELDALSAFQMLGSKYPVVSVWSSGSAKSDCAKDFEYLNSFERIYLCLDNDENGKKATNEIARLFDFNKVYHVKLDLKDANDYLTTSREKEFVSLWWSAKRFLPEGIVSSNKEIFNIIDEDLNKDSVPYPFETLQNMTYGIRMGELVLLKAMEGIGKTELFRAFEHHLIKTTDANIGIIHLEEPKARMIKGLVGFELEKPVHFPDSQVSKEEIKATWEKLVKRDERLHIYTHFNSDDPDAIINTVRFMAGPCGCKYVFLDHITATVTNKQDEDERRALDYIITTFGHMVEDLNFSMFVISHVNDNGQTRGSRLPPKVAALVIDLQRDKLHDDPVVRNTTKMTVEKNRFGAVTGPAGSLWFDLDRFRVFEQLEIPK